MSDTKSYHEAAKSYFEALLQNHRDEQEVIEEIENTAHYLSAEGQADLAQALREVMVRYLKTQLNT